MDSPTRTQRDIGRAEERQNDEEQPLGQNANGDITRDFFAQLREFMQHRPAPTPNNTEEHQIKSNHVIEQFRRFQPPRFRGNEGPMATEEWIAELERIFEHMELSEIQKVSCARFQLAEDAGQWWQSHERTMTSEARRTLEWEEFKEIILNRYFPQALRDQKEIEFMNLRQGTNTITEYEHKFNSLSRYAPHLVNTDDRKARRFERGLRPEVGGIVSGLRLPHFRDVFERARIVSMSLGLENEQKPMMNQLKRKEAPSMEPRGNDTVRNVRPIIAEPPRITPLCPNCNKNHRGECYLGKDICFRCHQPGHKANECINRTNAPIGSGKAPVPRQGITQNPNLRGNAIPEVQFAEENENLCEEQPDIVSLSTMG